MKDTNIRQSRYINETVGSLILIAFVVFAGSIFLAGKAQGWFEGTVRLEATFMNAEGISSDEQGSFDLEEGNEVKIRSTRAGRVQSIEPTLDGGLKAVILVKERFHRYIREDSVARVKKKFGLAGDAYIEISGGKGIQIPKDGQIPCYKDEELMEIAQRALDRLEDAVVPMVVETTGVMSNANRIATQISSGKGLVGTMINDPTLSEDVRQSVNRMNELLIHTQDTVREATRLIKGAQKSWFVRKYIPAENEREYISPLYTVYGRSDRMLSERCERALVDARIKPEAVELSRAAYNLAMCRMLAGEIKEAQMLLQEAEMTGLKSGVGPMHVSMARITSSGLDAARMKEKFQEEVLSDCPREMDFAEYAEFVAASMLALVRAGGVSDADDLCDKFGRRIRSRGSEPARAAYFWSKGEIASSESSPDAGAFFDEEAKALAQSDLPLGMTAALNRAAESYDAAGRHEMAAIRYLTAGKSLVAQDLAEDGRSLLAKALAASQLAGSEELTSYIEAFIASKNVEKQE